jgi:hypothetical protein
MNDDNLFTRFQDFVLDYLVPFLTVVMFLSMVIGGIYLYLDT